MQPSIQVLHSPLKGDTLPGVRFLVKVLLEAFKPLLKLIPLSPPR